jgi:hypothetical protein
MDFVDELIQVECKDLSDVMQEVVSVPLNEISNEDKIADGGLTW